MIASFTFRLKNGRGHASSHILGFEERYTVLDSFTHMRMRMRICKRLARAVP